MTWPTIYWTSQDWRAVVQNIVASVLLIFAGDVLARTFFSVIGGTRARLSIVAGPTQQLKDVDWPFIRVRNHGLPLSPRTQAARGCIAFGKLDGIDYRFNWSSSGPVPLERVDIYGDNFEDLPLVVRAIQNKPGQALYRWVLLPTTAFLTDMVFLTQGPMDGTIAQIPLTDGVHELSLVVQSLDGSRTDARFEVNVPPWPGRISVRKR